jgi:hypothetical protein
MLQFRVRVSGVVDAEDRAGGRIALAGEIADLRVVSVDDERRILGKLAHRVSPARSDELELSVTIELVAKQVAQADRTWPQPACDLRQRRFVDLEQPELCLARGQERGGDAGDEVRAGAVVGEPDPAAQDASCHRRSRCLTVGRGDERGAQWKTACQLVDRARIELPEQLPRHGRAATGADESRQPSGRPCHEDLQPQRKARPHGPRRYRSGLGATERG